MSVGVRLDLSYTSWTDAKGDPSLDDDTSNTGDEASIAEPAVAAE